MAGMRIGHAIGNAKLIKAMNDVRYSFNSYPMTRLSVALGVLALSDQDYFDGRLQRRLLQHESAPNQDLRSLVLRLEIR